jgi:hypothetical protein
LPDVPRAFLVAVCAASSLDQRSNNFSLFQLIEEIHLKAVPVVIPLEIHMSWEFEEHERGRSYEWRIKIVDPSGLTAWASSPGSFSSNTRRFRQVSGGLRLERPGNFHVVVETRASGEPGEPWQPQAIRWPLEVALLPDEPAPAL